MQDNEFLLAIGDEVMLPNEMPKNETKHTQQNVKCEDYKKKKNWNSYQSRISTEANGKAIKNNSKWTTARACTSRQPYK